MKRFTALLLSLLLVLSLTGAMADSVESAPIDAIVAETDAELWTQDMAEAEDEAPEVMANAAEEEILISKSASAKNLVDRVETKILPSGEVEATVFLNTAYAGMGRTMWYVYAIEGENDPVVESFADQGISTNTKYVMNAKFTQGAGVLFGAYTDATAASSWTDTSDLIELMTNGTIEEMPSKPTDPKETAETVAFGSKALTCEKEQVTFPASRYHFVKLVLRKDAVFKLTKLVGTGGNPINGETANLVNVTCYAADDKDPDYTTGGVYLDKDKLLTQGTYWLRFTFHYYNASDPLALSYAFSLRPYVSNVSVKWTCKEVKNLKKSISPNKILHFTAKITPADADAVFGNVALNSYVENGYDEALSEDKKTLTFTAQNGQASDLTTFKVSVVDNLTGAPKSFELSIGCAPDKPDLKYHTVTVNSKNAFIESKRLEGSKVFVRGWIKKGKKWVVKFDEQALPGGGRNSHCFSGLKPNTTYNFKFVYYLKSGKTELPSKALTFKAKTGAKSAPVVQSVKVTNKSKYKGGWIDGYWDLSGSKAKWVKGHYASFVKYNVVVTLKDNPPKGVLGLKYGDKAVAGTGKTFKFEFKDMSGYPTEGTFCFYSDAKYGGYSPYTKVIKFS